MKWIGLLVATIVFGGAAGKLEAQATPPWDIVPVAGGGPDHLPALESNLNLPTAVAISPAGELLILTQGDYRVYAVDASGELRILLEAGVARDLAVDSQGIVYLATGYQAVVRFDPVTATKTEWIATDAVVTFEVDHVTVDAHDNIFVADEESGTIGRFDPDGTFHHVAGLNCPAYVNCPSEPTGDDGPALEARLVDPRGMAFDSAGNLFVSDYGHGLVRRIDAVTGIISAYALALADDLLFDSAGDLLYLQGNGVLRFDHVTGLVDTIAPVGISPTSFAADAAGRLYVADPHGYHVHRIDGPGIVQVVTGNGTPDYSGDGHLARSAAIVTAPFAVDGDGNLYLTDPVHHSIRRVDAATGIIAIYAGTGDADAGDLDDGEVAAQVRISPVSITIDPQGNVVFESSSSALGTRVRRIDRHSLRVQTFAGGGTSQSDGILAREASLSAGRLAYDPTGNLFLTDSRRVRKLDAATGRITTVAGGGTQSFHEGIGARQARFLLIADIGVTPQGDLYLSEESEILRLDQETATLWLAAGGGVFCTQDDCGTVPATSTWVNVTAFLAPDGYGNVYFIDAFSDAVRRIEARTGWATLQIGHGIAPLGESLPVTVSRPSYPRFDSQGRLYMVSSVGPRRIYRATLLDPPPLADAGPDQSRPCAGPAGAQIVLDASASSDPDSTAADGDDIAFYDWHLNFGQAGERHLGRGRQLTAVLPIGSSLVTLETIDRFGARATDTVQIDVGDDDRDGDGVGTCVDNCPDSPNPGQEDDDANHVGDVCDLCASDPTGDADGDGVCSGTDNCAELANPTQHDADVDGVGDACDICPRRPNAGQQEGGLCLEVHATVQDTCLIGRAELGTNDRSGWAMLYREVSPGDFDLLVGVRYERSALPGFDLLARPDGHYKVCVTASSTGQPTKFLGTTSTGQLVEIDADTGQTRPLGTLPGWPPIDIEIMDDGSLGVEATYAFGQGLKLERFHPSDGARAAPRALPEVPFAGMEFVGSTLYVTAGVLYTLDPATGDASYVGISIPGEGLAYQRSTGLMYSVVDSRELYRTSLATGTSEHVGRLPLPIEAIEFGSDGWLYGLHAQSQLLWIDPETAQIASGVLLDIELVTSFSLPGPEGDRDCVEFDKHGEDVLALNSLCEPARFHRYVRPSRREGARRR